jgi:hypothetical protein
MFAWLRALFGIRPRRPDDRLIDEDTAYAHSYGDRTGEVISVEPLPEPEPEPSEGMRSDLTGEVLRQAFEEKLEARKKLTT